MENTIVEQIRLFEDKLNARGEKINAQEEKLKRTLQETKQMKILEGAQKREKLKRGLQELKQNYERGRQINLVIYGSIGAFALYKVIKNLD